MVEEWRDIKGFEGFYKVSSLGRVKSLDRVVFAGENANHLFAHLNERILKPKDRLSHNGEKVYKQVTLHRDGVPTFCSVHRLVAQAFIPNPNNYPCVNHKDENPSNNCYINLEWCTYKYNNEYNNRVERCKQKISNTLKGRKVNRVLTDEQREHIREGAFRGWETRRRKSAIESNEAFNG